MGFNKYPDRIENLNFSMLTNIQCFAIGEYMGIRSRLMQLPNVVTRREMLKARCFENELSIIRAQEGYDVIVRGKKSETAKDAVSPDVERRTYEIIGDIIRKNDEEWIARGKEGVAILIDGVKKEMQGFAKKALAEAADNFKPIGIVQKGKPTKKVTGVLPAEFEHMLQLASARIPIMLVGPAGCGKTYLCEKLGEALSMEFSDQSCSEGMSESVFNGLLLPIGKGGEFKHVASPFMERYETGGVMLLDEIDAGDANLFTYINKAIANDSYTAVQRWAKPVVKKHGDFVLVAAANTFGNGADAMYVGRNQLDAATLDRFKIGLITMDYSREVEKSLADEELCEWAWKVRDSIRANKLRRIMSTRVIKDLGTMREMYKWDIAQCAKAYFGGWSQADKNAVGAC